MPPYYSKNAFREDAEVTGELRTANAVTRAPSSATYSSSRERAGSVWVWVLVPRTSPPKVGARTSGRWRCMMAVHGC